MNPLPHYPLPWTTIGQVALAVLRPGGSKVRRSFRADAQACVARLRPPLRVYGREHVPQGGPCVLTLNHYARPGFQAAWLALAVSAAVPADVHWIMTTAWTYSNALCAHTITPLTRWLFGRIARVYGFTPMPPMPPDPRDVAARAVSARQVLAYAHRRPQPLIGLAPEGRDAPDGVLQRPAPGSGRFLCHLAQLGLWLAPIGGYEAGGALCLRFGPPYRLQVSPHLSAGDRDLEASEIVMRHIAAQLPRHLRGEFATPEEEAPTGSWITQ